MGRSRPLHVFFHLGYNRGNLAGVVTIILKVVFLFPPYWGRTPINYIKGNNSVAFRTFTELCVCYLDSSEALSSPQEEPFTPEFPPQPSSRSFPVTADLPSLHRFPLWTLSIGGVTHSCGLLCLASLELVQRFQGLSCCSRCQRFIPFYGCVILHYIGRPHFVYLFFN